MKRVAVVQARMGSSRLPKKILADVSGRPMLARQLARMRQCVQLDEIVVATTVDPADDPVVDLARREGAGWFRGDEHDVLSRYVGAARQAKADVIVRITADCPLIDPEVLGLVVDRLQDASSDAEGACDYASNTIERTFPRGLDTEAFFSDVLFRMDRLGRTRAAREHVTWFLHRERPDLFVTRSVRHTSDHSDLRWTVDTPEDLALVRAVYEAAGLSDRNVPYDDLVSLVRADVRLMTMNHHIAQKAI